MSRRQKIIVAGASGSGKTAYCQALVNQAHHAGLATFGILSVPVYDGSVKISISIFDISTGETRCLAIAADQTRESQAFSVLCGTWAFSQNALDWGNMILANVPRCDVLIIDEIGPLELRQNRGWMRAFPAVAGKDYLLAVVCVRPGLLPLAEIKIAPDRIVNLSGSGRVNSAGYPALSDLLNTSTAAIT